MARLEEEHKCPNCGSSLFRKTDSGMECVNCSTRFMNPYDTRSTNINIIRDEAKIEKVRAGERKHKRSMIASVITVLFCIGIFVGFYLFIDNNTSATPPANRASEYAGQNIQIVTQLFKDSGFKNVETISLHDVTSSDQTVNQIATIYIGGEEEWEEGFLVKNRKTFKKSTPVKIYYHGP